MSERYEDDLMEDLFYDEAEGFDDAFDAGDEFGSSFEDEEEDMWEGEDEDYYDDEFDEFDTFDDYDEFEDEADEMEEEMDDAMAYALGAEDTDEFLGKIFGGLKKIGRKIFRGVRRIAPRITSLLPGPYGAMLNTGLKLLGRLRYDGASEDEALEAFSELASYDEAAVPVLSALAIRSLDKKKVKRLPKAIRKKLVQKMNEAAKQLIRKSQNPKVVRAIPIVVGKVKARAATRSMPVTRKTEAAAKIIKKLAQSKRLAGKLTKTTPRVVRAKKAIRRAMGSRRLPV